MLDQRFVDAVYHLGKFVVEEQSCILQILMDENTALIQLIPGDFAEGLDEEDYDGEI